MDLKSSAVNRSFGIFAMASCVLLVLVISSASAAGPTKGPHGITDAQKARIKAALAENLPMDQIIKEASEAGISMGSIVATLIGAGAAPSAVVSSAVTLSKAAGDNEAVSAAITAALRAAGKEAQRDIIAAAIAAGADPVTVASAAKEAGMSGDDAADSLYSSGSSAPPVYGYSAPQPAGPPPSYGPSGPVVIGGGGGGGGYAAKPASPTKPKH